MMGSLECLEGKRNELWSSLSQYLSKSYPDDLKRIIHRKKITKPLSSVNPSSDRIR